MKIRIYNNPNLHLLGNLGEDRRIAFTKCNIRFAWGEVPGAKVPLPNCSECWSKNENRA